MKLILTDDFGNTIFTLKDLLISKLEYKWEDKNSVEHSSCTLIGNGNQLVSDVITLDLTELTKETLGEIFEVLHKKYIEK